MLAQTNRVVTPHDRFREDLELGGHRCRRTVLTPERHLNLLNPSNYPRNRKLLQRRLDCWLFRNFRPDGKDEKGRYEHHLELRAYLLDRGEPKEWDWWTGGYRQTPEGRRGWRLPSAEEFAKIGCTLYFLGRSPEYCEAVRCVLDGDRRFRGLRKQINDDARRVMFADYVQYGEGLEATIANPYGKARTVQIPEYPKYSGVEIAPEKPENFLSHQTTPNSASWLEALVGPLWSQLGRILQFVAPRIKSLEGELFLTQEERERGWDSLLPPGPLLSRVKLVTPDRQWRKRKSRRLVSIEFGGDVNILNTITPDYDQMRAIGVRDLKEYI